MNKKSRFIKGVERLVDPIEVGSIHFLYGLNKLLPIKLQEYLSKRSSKKFPYMGFVVEPYGSFLFYKIKDLEWAKSLLPEGFRLIKTKVFISDEAHYYAIFGAFRAHTSAFWGSRLEFYVIAENQATGLLSWIIINYDSNTIGQDKRFGLRGPNAEKSVVTINHRGSVFVDFKNQEENRQIAYEFNVQDGLIKELDPRLWIEGNLSITYGKFLKGSTQNVFSLRFEPCEMEKALQIPTEKLEGHNNSWFPGLIENQPEVVLCFPYAQHFISDSPGYKSSIKNKEQLVESIESLDFKKIKPFSVKPLRNLVLMQNVITTALLLAVAILVYLLVSR